MRPQLPPSNSPPGAAGGGNGAGTTAKLCNNLVLGVSMAAVSEGLALGKQLGLVSARGALLFPAGLWQWVGDAVGARGLHSAHPLLPATPAGPGAAV